MSGEGAEQPPVSGLHGHPGRLLAEQREAIGWTVEQVADQLKLAVRQVKALEEGDFAALPGPAVVRGFVRAYAKVVKLDPVPLVAMIALDVPAASDATSTTVRRDKPTSFSEVRFPTNGKRAAFPVGLVAGVVLLAAVAGAVVYFDLLPSRLWHRGDAASAPAASATPNTSAPAAAKPGEAGIETTLVKPGQELTPVQSTSVPLISVPPPAGASAAAPAAGSPAGVAPAPAAPAAANALVIKVREDSWIELRRAAGGAPLMSRLVKAGNTETFEVTEPVSLVVGKATGVDATFRGAPVALPPLAGSTVARVTLK